MNAADRRWLEIRVRYPSAGDLAGLLADGLLALGARGVEERGAWFVAYFDEPSDPEAFVRSVERDLMNHAGVSSVTLEHGWQLHEEWAENWKRGLGPRRLTDRIVVHPSWAPPDEVRAADVVIVIDPGMAFGTAEHGTTRGCLRLLDGLVRTGDRVLDVGAGSGILSIAAARLGAGAVTAIEGDAYACEAMEENITANRVDDRVSVVREWASAESLARRGPVEGVIANIEAGLLTPLIAGFTEALADGGWLLISGVLDHEWAGMEDHLRSAGFGPRAVDADGEWRSGLFDLEQREGQAT